MAAMGEELDLLLAEPLDALTTAERLSAAREWEALMRRQAAMGHRLYLCPDEEDETDEN